MGTLTTVLNKEKQIPEVILGMIALQVLRGLEYLHKKMHVIHRDLKPSNILLNSKGQVKIADFGVSGQMDSTTDVKNTFVGTMIYMSPERLKGERYFADTDLWALGLIILECALGKFPFTLPGKDDVEGLNFWELLMMIDKAEELPLPTEGYSDSFKDFIMITMNKKSG